jgi:2-polyprenyl-3-methyl-5-hydroxy-6-metoxy-1,4-benzoquinol methylase
MNTKIKNLIDEIREKVNEVENELAFLGLTSNWNKAEKKEIPSKDINKILTSDAWPEAVYDFQIVDDDSEDEKMNRAEGVIDILIQENLENKKFLDFGCGEGHMAKYASKDTIFSVGFDIIKSEKSKFDWEKEDEKFLLTTDINKVKEKAPYDIILIYDVLDHARNPEDLLNQARELLSQDGNIYLRCHPWCSRHGSHLYRKINKAFVHLVFTEKELEDMGYKTEEYNNKITAPILSYKEMIEDSKLKIKENYPEIEYQEVEDFFKNSEEIKNRILQQTSRNDFPEFQMSQCFLDYILTK